MKTKHGFRSRFLKYKLLNKSVKKQQTIEEKYFKRNKFVTSNELQ